WDVDDAERFARLALRYPELLTHEEQKRWKLMRENGFLWRGRYNSDNEWEWEIKDRSLILNRVREHWDRFCAVARGDAEAAVLPTWAEKNPTGKKTDDFDDDIPF
ncbi:MAG: hypothetical protein WA624_16900, partial [Methylocella sp.]